MAVSLKETLKTILVVDDDEMVLKVVVAILENANFRVLSADSGAHAMKLAEKRKGQFTCYFPMWTCHKCQAHN